MQDIACILSAVLFVGLFGGGLIIAIVGVITVVVSTIEDCYGCKINHILDKSKFQRGDTYFNYLKYLNKCGTCKYRNVERSIYGNSLRCDLSGENTIEDSTCDYYKMHRCFKKYERRV